MLQALNCVLTVRKYSVKSNFRYKTKNKELITPEGCDFE